MDYIYKTKPKAIKCRVCNKVIRDDLRATNLTIKGTMDKAQAIKMCERCLYRLPSDLIRDILGPKFTGDFDFGNKIFSAFMINKCRDLNQGCVILLQVPHIKGGEIDIGCSYRFVKFPTAKDYEKECHKINPLGVIDSVYMDGRKLEIL